MNLEQLKKAISEAFEKATEALEACVNEIGEAAKILEEYPHKETKEEPEAWRPDVTICTSIGDLAAEDYYEIQEDGTKKTEFTWDEAMEIEKKTNGKWRLPTIFEWDKLVAEFGGYLGELARDAFVNGLNLTEDEYGEGHYWTSTYWHSRADDAYSLDFDNFCVNRNYVSQCVGRSVRLVRDSKQ